MKVYIYIQSSKVVLLSGVLSTMTSVSGEDLKLNYSATPKSGHVMVSLTADEFVYLQDQGVLVEDGHLLN